ncbi:MAG: NUDIX hydrolase, partial [Pseudomonadota bacterium]
AVASADNLHPLVEEKLLSNLRGRPSQRRTRGIALAAIRETYEEAGLLIGENDQGYRAAKPDWHGFEQHGVAPSLSHLRLLARAITPPGRTRRFDAWFFVTTTDHIAVQLEDLPTQELQDLHWLNIDDALELDLPVITVSVLNDLKKRLARDPDLKPETPLPFYHMRHNRYVEEMI